MNVESKAKTSGQIVSEVCYSFRLNQSNVENIKKWVPLEEALKVEKLCEAALEYCSGCSREKRLTEARHIIEYAIKAAQKIPQPQDMKTRLTFDFDDFNSLCAVLGIQFISSQEVEKQ